MQEPSEGYYLEGCLEHMAGCVLDETDVEAYIDEHGHVAFPVGALVMTLGVEELHALSVWAARRLVWEKEQAEEKGKKDALSSDAMG